jgi:hypothetical protein
MNQNDSLKHEHYYPEQLTTIQEIFNLSQVIKT